LGWDEWQVFKNKSTEKAAWTEKICPSRCEDLTRFYNKIAFEKPLV
jgi:hypothetical protein